jgi:predicted CopG family antitoxin
MREGKIMRKKLTLTIDSEVYDMIKELPRKVSISEVVSWLLKSMYQDLKKGRELTQEELNEWLDSTLEGRDFHERFRERFGPTVKQLETSINAVKQKIGPGKPRS